MSITLDALNNLIDQAADRKERHVRCKAEMDDAKKDLDHTMNLIKSALKDADLKNYKNGRGMAILSNHWRCTVPKEPEKRGQFFDWLKDKGWFDEWITVHSATLNSEYKRLYEEAAKEGEILEIPGIGLPIIQEQCSLRKA